ncbi:membrane protein [Devosia pacifica]|uniref:Membrane protein n=1 Tax=Devosia pacifica TaxID=1335967 RepID=A0A918VNK7_9HYPH|nr:M23 family metallopeptidase [Devosia pacifica]GHA10781.1 membrane protein [Devosia pacifica]
MLTNALTAVGFFMSSDIARLVSGRNELLISAYEERISELRVAVDRLYSRNYAQTGDINLQLQDLAHRQQELVEQHQLVRALAGRARTLGIEPAAAEPDDALNVGSYSPRTGDGSDIEQTASALQDMLVDSRRAMAGIATAATAQTDRIVEELNGLGINTVLPMEETGGVGGPFIPASWEEEDADLVGDANAVMSTLMRYEAARQALSAAPVHTPISGSFRKSSNFGNRRDPFSGKSAFHAGIDFAAATGTTILGAGDGLVSFAGRRSGYGNVVEIAHTGTQLTTVYAHMSAILVREGQRVTTGSPIGKVGSTGRSTGPHLHFEVRRDGKPMNPKQFLDAGLRLSQVI